MFEEIFRFISLKSYFSELIVYKRIEFDATQILREINLGKCRVTKMSLLELPK